MRTFLLLALIGCTDKQTETEVDWADGDGDGVTAEEGDCDDADATISPEAVEICDGLDNDCDGSIDEDIVTVFYADADGDGHGDDATGVEACLAPSGHIPVGGDCDDAEPEIHPNAVEVCDNRDNDCDGLIDADDDSLDASGLGMFYADDDGDGYGDDATLVQACEAPDQYVAEGGDCDDADTAYNPGVDESDCTDPADYNCDGSVGYTDEDGDGYAACEDCDDSDSAISPDAVEVCDGVDNDCDNLTDDEDTIEPAGLTTFYADADGDSYGDPAATTDACEAPSGYTDVIGDCDDTDSAISPDGEEVCDDADNDCDGTIDVGATDAQTFYADADLDGFGDVSTAVEDCEAPSGYLTDDADCDDDDADVNPDATELCDGLDGNCDGSSDDAGLASFAADTGTWTDLTATLSAGTSSSPVSWELSDDGELWLCEGTWYSVLTVTASDAAVRGFSGAALTTLSAGATASVITAGAVALTVDGLTVSDGYNGSCGGGIDATGTTLTLNDSVLLDNEASTGGGLCLSSGTLSLESVEMSDNLTDDAGGGLYLDTVTAAMVDLTLDGNLAVAEGGGFYSTHSTIFISGADIDKNESEDRGGGIYLHETTLSASGMVITGNIAVDEGGGIAVRNNSTLTLSGSTISQNEASKDGGGIHVKDGSLSMSSSTLEANVTAKKGGGLHIDDDDATLDEVVLIDNVANEGGGAFVKDCELILIDCELTDNTANDDGGGVTVEHHGSLTVTTSDWSGNAGDDVYLKHKAKTYSYGSSETFSCSDEQCQ